MSILDIIGQIFWFGILATPLIAFFCVRKLEVGFGIKILVGVLITAVLAVLFYVIALGIIFRNGLGPG